MVVKDKCGDLSLQPLSWLSLHMHWDLWGIDPNTKKIVIGVILIVTILISTINKQMIKDIKLRLFYHNNKNIEAINDRTAAAVKDMKKQIKRT